MKASLGTSSTLENSCSSDRNLMLFIFLNHFLENNLCLYTCGLQSKASIYIALLGGGLKCLPCVL